MSFSCRAHFTIQHFEDFLGFKQRLLHAHQAHNAHAANGADAANGAVLSFWTMRVVLLINVFDSCFSFVFFLKRAIAKFKKRCVPIPGRLGSSRSAYVGDTPTFKGGRSLRDYQVKTRLF